MTPCVLRAGLMSTSHRGGKQPYWNRPLGPLARTPCRSFWAALQPAGVPEGPSAEWAQQAPL
eukprot:3520766-Alexandrium_andersonii.AAC.1